MIFAVLFKLIKSGGEDIFSQEKVQESWHHGEKYPILTLFLPLGTSNSLPPQVTSVVRQTHMGGGIASDVINLNH